MINRGTDSVTILNSDGITGKRIGTHNGCEYVQLTIKPGSVVAPHSLDFPLTFYVIEGMGTALIEGKEFVAEKGDLIDVGSGISRQWSNKGSQTLSLLVIKHTGVGL